MAESKEKLTWRQILTQYPDEWVLLEDYEPDIDFDGKGIISTKGRVIAHARKRKEFDGFLRNIKVPDAAIRYTGEMIAPRSGNLWTSA